MVEQRLSVPIRIFWSRQVILLTNRLSQDAVDKALYPGRQAPCFYRIYRLIYRC